MSNLDAFQITGLIVGNFLNLLRRFLTFIIKYLFKILEWIYEIIRTSYKYLLDFIAVIAMAIGLVLVLLYFWSGGSNRKKNNMYDSVISGSTTSIQINDYDNPEMDYNMDDNKDKSYFKQSNIYKYFTEYYNDFIKTLARMFAKKQTIETIDEKYLSERKFYNNGRCNNITNTDKNGYCYNQLKSKKIDWNDMELSYKLLSKNNMKTNDDKHYDYYVPNCKATNLFKKEYISTCEKGKRMNYICEI